MCACVRARALAVKYSTFLVSLFWASPLSLDVPADAVFLCDKAALLGVTIKERRGMTGQPFNLQIYWGSVSQEIVRLLISTSVLVSWKRYSQKTTFSITPETNPLCATVSFVCVMHCAFCLTRTVTSRSFTDLECPHVFMQTSFRWDFYLCRSFAEKDGKTFMKGIWNTVKCEIKVMMCESKLGMGVMKLGLSHWGRNARWRCCRIGCRGGY